ncbi:YHYH domain-containing protein [Kiloniella majae]|nr:YHYH domain-containing protein [Kiloniella majae]
MKQSILAIIAVLALGISAAYSHSGGTDSNGCHNETATGGYHCH